MAREPNFSRQVESSPTRLDSTCQLCLRAQPAPTSTTYKPKLHSQIYSAASFHVPYVFLGENIWFKRKFAAAQVGNVIFEEVVAVQVNLPSWRPRSNRQLSELDNQLVERKLHLATFFLLQRG